MVPPRGARAAALLSAAALALAAGPVAGRVRGRRCHVNATLPAAELLSGEHFTIGMYVSGHTNQCIGSACELYGRVTREDNKKYRKTRSGSRRFEGFKVWTGFDIELIEELAERGNFNYTIVSMGGGDKYLTIANTMLNGTYCENCSNYTAKARFMLGADGPDDYPDVNFTADQLELLEQLEERNVTVVDIMGGGTWKYSADRTDWAIWSSPVLSDSTLLLIKPPVFKRSPPSRSMLTDPFATNVWVYIFLAALFFTAVFWATAVKHPKTANEVAPIEIAYNTFTQCFGFGVVDPTDTMQRGITLGWMMFCIVVMEFWSSELTAQLVRPGKYAPATTWSDITNSSNKLNLCVEAGAANENHFKARSNASKSRFKVDGKSTVFGKIEGVLDGSCTGSELDEEGYNYHFNREFQKNGQCKAVTAKQPISRRARGMMAHKNASCIITGINGLIHEYSIAQCEKDIRTPLDINCNLFSLWAKHFSEPECTLTLRSTEADDEAAAELQWEVFVVPFEFLAAATCIGAVFTAIGRGRMTLAVPGCGARRDGRRWSHRTFGRSIAFGCDTILDWPLFRMFLKSKEARFKRGGEAWDGDANHAAFERTQYGLRSSVKPAVWKSLHPGARHLLEATEGGRHHVLDEYDLYGFTGEFSDVADIAPDPDAPNSSQPKRSLYPCDRRTENQIWFGRSFERLQPPINNKDVKRSMKKAERRPSSRAGAAGGSVDAFFNFRLAPDDSTMAETPPLPPPTTSNQVRLLSSADTVTSDI